MFEWRTSAVFGDPSSLICVKELCVPGVPVRAFKAVKQNYQPTTEILKLLDDFRLMVNDCLRIGVETGATSLKALSVKAYRQLSAYNIPSYYKLCAISNACGMLKNYRKTRRKNPHAKTPYARRMTMTTCYGFKINDGKLKLPLGNRRYVEIALGSHTRQVLSNPSLTVRSVCLTARTVNLSYSKETDEINPAGFIGIDRNLDNVTIADTASHMEHFDLSKASEVKTKYRAVTSRFERNDIRVRTRILQKYGFKQREKVRQILHHTSKIIVQEAKDQQYALVMEKLTGMRKLYRRGNAQGPNYRFRLNSWSFAELQRQIEYKACWEGLPVIYVKPHGTSAKCSICGSRMMRIPEENRKLKCAGCGFRVDRDENAARNILARALRFGAVGPAIEAMVQERSKVILKVDAGQLTSKHPPTS